LINELTTYIYPVAEVCTIVEYQYPVNKSEVMKLHVSSDV